MQNYPGCKEVILSLSVLLIFSDEGDDTKHLNPLLLKINLRSKDEKAVLCRKRKAMKQKRSRERRRERLGDDVVLEMERERRRRRYIKVADLPQEELEERRRKIRESMRKYRQTLKQKLSERGIKQET